MKFYSHGKLLLTGEYTVLQGAQALALPTKQGQSLTVTASEENALHWKSYASNGSCWFEAVLELDHFSIIQSSTPEIAMRLSSILKAVRQQNQDFCRQGTTVTTQLEFDLQWGLGSSSTLLANLSQWAGVDPYQLLKISLGGSGYDIACAQASQALLYQWVEGTPIVESTPFGPPFKEELYFVYLNQKQDSQKEVAAYQKKAPDPALIASISGLTQELVLCETLTSFMAILHEHENLMADHLNRVRIQEERFSDFKGCVKSLGAWGGDFVMACGGSPTYFKNKGYSVIRNYSGFIL